MCISSTLLKVVEETYNCSDQCESLDASIDQNQLAYRLIKLRIRVLRANIGKLLCLCVPSRDTWAEFAWDGKTVDEILDDLSKIDIPVYNPGDPEFQRTFMEHENLNRQYFAAEKILQQEHQSKINVLKGVSEQPQENMDLSPIENGITEEPTETLVNELNKDTSETNVIAIDGSEEIGQVHEKNIKENKN